MLKLMVFLKSYKKWTVSMLLLLFVQALGTLYTPTFTAGIVNSEIVAGDLNYVRETGVFMLVVALLTAGAFIGGTYISTYIATGMGSDIRKCLLFKTQSFSANDFNRFGAASMITRSTSDVVQIQQAFSALVQVLLPAPFMTITGLALASSKNRLLALIISGPMAFPIAFSAIVIIRVTLMFERPQTLMDKINRMVRDNIIGVRVIRVFNRAGHEKVRVDQSFADYAKTVTRANKFLVCVLPMVMGVMSLCTLLILWLGGKQVAAGNMQIGDIMAIIEYAVLILMYLIVGVTVSAMAPRAQACAQRINAVLDMEPEISDNAASGKVVKLEDPASYGEVEFRNVTFRHEHTEENVFHGISSSVREGQTTAIIGGTGSGKSTTVSLLMCFYDIQEGNMLTKGRDIREYGQRELRDMIGYVPQKAFPPSGIIADNLRHGEKDVTDLETHHATAIAQTDDFIRGHKKGLGVLVSQRGGSFSGGQKQRLSIARVVIREPDIFLFDNSFSVLDFRTDAGLRKALKQEVKESAVIIVAQRINTITDADQIIVLDEGRAVRKGAHRTLMVDCSVYQNIVQSQPSQEEFA